MTITIFNKTYHLWHNWQPLYETKEVVYFDKPCQEPVRTIYYFCKECGQYGINDGWDYIGTMSKCQQQAYIEKYIDTNKHYLEK